MPQLLRYERSMKEGGLMVKDFRTLRSDAAGILNEALNRLGIEPIPDRDPSLDRQSNARSYDSPIPSGLVRRLRAYYSDDVRQVKGHFGIQIAIDW